MLSRPCVYNKQKLNNIVNHTDDLLITLRKIELLKIEIEKINKKIERLYDFEQKILNCIVYSNE